MAIQRHNTRSFGSIFVSYADASGSLWVHTISPARISQTRYLFDDFMQRNMRLIMI